MKVKKIALVGPLCAGKTFMAYELKRVYNLMHVPADAIIWYYHIKNNIDFEKAQKLRETDAHKYLKYCEDYNYKAVKSILNDFTGVIDFGATHTFFLNKEYREDVKSLLRSKNTFLLLPSENENTNIKILNKRLEQRLKGISRTTKSIQTWKTLNEKMVQKNYFQEQSIFHIFTHDILKNNIAQTIFNKVK